MPPLPSYVPLKEIRMFTFRSREDGQTMAEYAVILGVIAVVIVLAIGHALDRDQRTPSPRWPA